MTKKNILERLVKLAAFGVLLSTSSCANMPTQGKAQKAVTTEQKTSAYKKSAMYELDKANLINAWTPMAEKVEGFYPYVYECTSGAKTIGIGSELKSVGGIEKIPLRDLNNKLVSPAKKQAYVKKANSESYSRSERIAERNGIKGITKQDAYKLLYQEASEKLDKLVEDTWKREKIDLLAQPFEIQLLTLDRAYQLGSAGVFRDRAYWKCIRTGNFKNLHKHVVCCTNKDRNVIKRALAGMAAAREEGKSLEPFLALIKARGVPLKLEQFHQNHRSDMLIASKETGKIYDSALAKKSETHNGFKNSDFSSTLPIQFRMNTDSRKG